MIILSWLLIVCILGLVTIIGKRNKILPIVSQLCTAIILIPLLYWVGFSYLSDLNFLSFFKHEEINTTVLLNNSLIKAFYSVNFAILVAYILSDMVDIKCEKKSILIALPSFLVPFIAGVLTALFILKEEIIISVISIGLLSAITAIPVLYLYLKNFNYNINDLKKLMHAAILMDIFCWTIFALAKNDIHIILNIIVILLGLSPIILSKVLKVRHSIIYSCLFFLSMIVIDYYKLNILLYGIIYMLSLTICKIQFKLPISAKIFNQYQVFVAIPFIISYGVMQIDYKNISTYSMLSILSLLFIPIISKILGSWLGLYIADVKQNNKIRWFEAVMLNTRGLTEIVFLNMLFQQHIINSQIYFIMMTMGLLSTIFAGIYGNKKYRHIQVITISP